MLSLGEIVEDVTDEELKNIEETFIKFIQPKINTQSKKNKYKGKQLTINSNDPSNRVSILDTKLFIDKGYHKPINEKSKGVLDLL